MYTKWLPVAKVVCATTGALIVQIITWALADDGYVLSESTRLFLTVLAVFISGYLAPRTKPTGDDIAKYYKSPTYPNV